MKSKNANCKRTMAIAFKYMATEKNRNEMRYLLDEFMFLLKDSDIGVKT